MPVKVFCGRDTPGQSYD